MACATAVACAAVVACAMAVGSATAFVSSPLHAKTRRRHAGQTETRRAESPRPPVQTATSGGRCLPSREDLPSRRGVPTARSSDFRLESRGVFRFSGGCSGKGAPPFLRRLQRQRGSSVPLFLPTAAAPNDGFSVSSFLPATATRQEINYVDLNEVNDGGVNVDNLDVNDGGVDGEQNENVDDGDEKGDDENDCENNDNQDQFQRIMSFIMKS
nr:zinc finger BED domain-containing protein RICESLEEPER 2-like [Ipomoea batatas]